MKRLSIIACLLAVAPGAASAQNAPASPLEQSLTKKLMAEIGDALQCNAAVISIQQQLAKANARVAELEEKLKAAEPKE